jgi:SAM-dependent methyltransferase
MYQQPAARDDSDLVANFLRNVRGAIPVTIEQIDVMLRLLAEARDGAGVANFLDLGCADGVLSSAILNEFSDARGVMVDFSEGMIDRARQQLEAHAARVEYVCADYTKSGWVREIQHALPFDAVVSGFPSQHSADERKRRLFGEIFAMLKPGGIFISVEHVTSATRWTESVWDDCMIDAIFGKQLSDSPGRSRAEIAREYYAGTDGPRHAPLEVQCDWLRECGFENVDCFLKVSELAVFGGQRPA